MTSPVDVTLDVSSVPENPMGAGRYVVELARHLTAATDVLLTVIARQDDRERWSSMPGTAEVLDIVPKSRPARLIWEQMKLPSVINALAPGLHHAPHYTMAERAKVPTVVTIHDMTFFDHPEWHERAKVMVFRRAIEKAAHKAAHLVAVSHDTAQRLQDRFGPLSVTPIPLGVDHARFRPTPMSGTPEGDEEIRLLATHGIKQPYVAFVGTLEPRKNVPALLQAFDRLAPKYPKLSLVLAGKAGWGLKAIDDVLQDMKHADRIVATGFIADELIPPFLRHAAVVAYPSLTEGFGLPALEALACGAPLVTTTGSAMEEVVEDAALLVHPGDVTALTEAIEELLRNEQEIAHMQMLGPRVAAKYTWERTGQAHVELYRRLLTS